MQSTEDLRRVFGAGASQVTGGSIAVKEPRIFEEWLLEFGAEKIILGADVKNGRIAIGGWQERSDWDLLEFINHYAEKGIRHVICTDVSKDGLLRGPALSLYRELVSVFPNLSIVASGGVSSTKDLQDLESIGVAGTIVGKAIYEGKITLQQLMDFSDVN